MKQLLDIIGHEAAQKPNYCGQRYDKWEAEVAEPALHDLGFKQVRWHSGESDSFGPLSRVASCLDSDGNRVQLMYG